MNNNSTSAINASEGTCAGDSASATYWHYRDIGRWYFYAIVETIYFFGVIGNIISLLAFLKQAKLQKSYYHQLAIIFSDLLCILFNVLGSVSYIYLDVWDNIGPDFIQKSWPLLLFFGWCYAFLEMTATASLVLINGVCIDRLYALTKPVEYRQLSHAKMAGGLLAFSYAIGILSNLYDCFVKKVKWRESAEIYVLYNDLNVRAHPVVAVLTYFMLGLRVFLLFSLFILALLSSRKYTKTMKDRLKAKNKGSKPANGQKPVNDRTLAMLMFAQSFMVIMGTL